jgi:thioredoxin reductase (NADPH)
MTTARIDLTGLAETPDHDGAFPRLTEDQVGALSVRGERRPVAEGDVLFHEGDLDYDLHVILSGKVAVISDLGGDEQLIATHGERRFLGELGLLTGSAAFFSTVVAEPGEVLVVPVQDVREAIAQDSSLGDVILRAFLLRRELLIGLGAGFRIIGSRFSPETRRLREFAARNRLPHRWIDLEDDPEAERLLLSVGVRPEETPVVLWHGEVLRNPTPEELARAIGLPAPDRREATADLIIVGSGPAGLAAAVYGASEGLATVALDAVATGGQAATSSRIENYLGFPSGISGAELAERATLQARKFGAQITVSAQVAALEREEGRYVLRLEDGGMIAGHTVVIATGARYRRLPVARLEEFEGEGVFYAATLMEARMCAGDPVAVVGGGNSAGQATCYLARHSPSVRIIVRGDDLAASMSRYLVDRIERMPNVEILLHSEVRELLGERRLEAVLVEDRLTGERRRLDLSHLFVFIGAAPHTQWLGDQVALDDHGFVLTGPDARAARSGAEDPLWLESSLPGVLAVGDVRHGSTKRVASAVGEGAMAVRMVHEHLSRAHSQARPL